MEHLNSWTTDVTEARCRGRRKALEKLHPDLDFKIVPVDRLPPRSRLQAERRGHKFAVAVADTGGERVRIPGLNLPPAR